MTGYTDISEASKAWGITTRRIRALCEAGRIDGVIKLHNNWFIPLETQKPLDGRRLKSYKNKAIKIGIVDVDTFESLKKDNPVSLELVKSDFYKELVASALSYFLKRDGELEITKKEIKEILSGQIVPRLDLNTHYLVSNFNALMIELYFEIKLSAIDMKTMYSRLLQGIDNFATYRKGKSYFSKLSEEKEATVEKEVPALFWEYQVSYQHLHPISQGVIFYSEIQRIGPFEHYNGLIAYLMLSTCLISQGIFPPLMKEELVEEETAALVLACKRGIFNNLTSLLEREMKNAYKEKKKYL